MRKAIGIVVIGVSIILGLYLHDIYINTVLQEQSSAGGSGDVDIQLEFINDQIIPSQWPGGKNPIGGLSGLAWSPLDNILYAVSDDRGRSGPSRYYSLQLNEKINGQFEVLIQKVFPIKNEKKEIYPERSMDSEGITVDKSGWIYISSEGDFEANESAVPMIMQLNKFGEVVRKTVFGKPFFPEDKASRAKTYGIRSNLAFESLDYEPQSEQIVTTTESALIQDGDLSTFEKGTHVRFIFFKATNDGELSMLNQKVYEVSSIPSRRPVKNAKVGVTDLVLLDSSRLLVLERTYLKKRSKNRVKLFFADCSQATDVKALDSLKGADFKTCVKKPLYDFDLLIGQLSEEHPRVDNIEGMEVGPLLEDGSRLLMFISDNNFNDKQRTQVLFFKVRGLD